VRAYRVLLVYQSLLALGVTTSGTFIPFFYLERSGGLLPTIEFFLVGFAMAAAGSWALTRLPQRDSRRVMAAGVLLYAAALPTILLLPSDTGPFPAGLAWGLMIPLFFLPLNTLTAELTKEGDRAVMLGGLFLGFTAVGIVGPTLGGFLVSVGGYAANFAFGMAVFVLAAGVLMVSPPWPAITYRLDLRRMGARLCAGSLAQGGMEGALTLAAPAVLFTHLQSPQGLGLFLSAFAVAGGVTTILLGRISDRIRRRGRFIVLGSGLTSAAAVGVAISGDLAQYAAANSFLQLAFVIGPLFLFTAAVDRFGHDKADAVATREVLLNSGRVIGLLAFWGVLAAGLSPLAGFGIVALSALGMAAGSAREGTPRGNVAA